MREVKIDLFYAYVKMRTNQSNKRTCKLPYLEEKVKITLKREDLI